MRVAYEYCACDCFKVMARCCDRLILEDRLQFEDILAAVKKDMEAPDRVHPVGESRPDMPSDWAANWTSDDNYTRTKGNPRNAGEALRVITLMAAQLMQWDGMSEDNVLAVLESDLHRHYVEFDV